MSDDENSTPISATAVQELLKFGKWIVARRALKREDLFKSGVEPILDELSEIHSEFLRVLVSTRGGIEELVQAADKNANNFADLISTHRHALANAKELLERGRLRRRQLYEQCLARYVDLNEQSTVNSLDRMSFLDPSDFELLAKFYEALLSYFRNDAKTYNHSMRDVIGSVQIDLTLLEQDGFDATRVDRLRTVTDEMIEKERVFNDLWSQAVGVRYQLELRLK